MSLTVIGLMALLVGMVLTVGAALIGMDTDSNIVYIVATLFLAISVTGFVITVSSYNENARETTERNKIECIENGGVVMKVEGSNACMSSGSEWRGWIG